MVLKTQQKSRPRHDQHMNTGELRVGVKLMLIGAVKSFVFSKVNCHSGRILGSDLYGYQIVNWESNKYWV